MIHAAAGDRGDRMHTAEATVRADHHTVHNPSIVAERETTTV
jgi:hypothetical protein